MLSRSFYLLLKPYTFPLTSLSSFTLNLTPNTLNLPFPLPYCYRLLCFPRIENFVVELDNFFGTKFDSTYAASGKPLFHHSETLFELASVFLKIFHFLLQCSRFIFL